MDKPLLLDINIELLSGCTWSCSGCHVGKTEQSGFVGNDGERLNALVDEFLERGYTANFLNITPTDFMTAQNTLDVLRDKNVQALVNKFNYWYLTTTFLKKMDDHQQEIIDTINELYADTNLYFYIVMNPMKVLNQKYMQTIVDKKQEYTSRLKTKSLRQFAIFNWFDYPDKAVMQEHLRYVETSSWYRKHFNANQDYVMSFARRPGMARYKKEFVECIDWLNDVIAAEVPRDNDIELHERLESLQETSYTAYDFLNRRYTYRNGEFFFVPFLVACLVNFDPSFRVPLKEWTVDDFERCEQEMLVQQYANLQSKSRCSQCEHVGKCAERQILHTLDVINYDGCVAPLQQYQDQFKNW